MLLHERVFIVTTLCQTLTLFVAPRGHSINWRAQLRGCYMAKYLYGIRLSPVFAAIRDQLKDFELPYRILWNFVTRVKPPLRHVSNVSRRSHAAQTDVPGLPWLWIVNVFSWPPNCLLPVRDGIDRRSSLISRDRMATEVAWMWMTSSGLCISRQLLMGSRIPSV